MVANMLVFLRAFECCRKWRMPHPKDGNVKRGVMRAGLKHISWMHKWGYWLFGNNGFNSKATIIRDSSKMKGTK